MYLKQALELSFLRDTPHAVISLAIRLTKDRLGGFDMHVDYEQC